MKKLQYIVYICLCGFFFFSFSTKLEASSVPMLNARVTDTANIIPDDVEKSLEEQLRVFEEKTSDQVVVVTIPKLPSDETIESEAYNIFNENQLGTKGNNNGVLLLIAKEDRKMRIEVGYGLEPIIPDILAGRIIRDTIAPKFVTEKYAEGVQEGVNIILETLDKGDVYKAPSSSSSINAEGWLVIVFILLQFVVHILFFMSKSKSVVAGGVFGAVLAGIGFIFVQSLWVFLLIIVGVCIDWLVSGPLGQKIFKGWKSGRGGRGGFWMGGTGGFGGGSGGFGGGGGSSGGGGASGSW